MQRNRHTFFRFASGRDLPTPPDPPCTRHEPSFPIRQVDNTDNRRGEQKLFTRAMLQTIVISVVQSPSRP